MSTTFLRTFCILVLFVDKCNDALFVSERHENVWWYV